MVHPYRLLVSALLGLVLLAGCGGDPKPLYAAPSSSSTPTSPGLTTTAPPTVDPRHESPKQFIRRWLSVSVAAEVQGQPDLLTPIDASGCQDCRNLQKLISKTYSAGGQIAGGGISVRSMIQRHREGSTLQYVVRVIIDPTTVNGTKTASPQQQPGGPDALLVTVRKLRGVWRMLEYGKLVTS